MVSRNRRRVPVKPSAFAVDMLEQRTLFSTAYGVMVMDAPRSPALRVQVDQSATPAAAHPGSPLPSALDVQVRVVGAGVYLNVEVSGLNSGDPLPTGTVDFSSELGFLGTVNLGSLNQGTAFRNFVVLPAGKHTFFATYSGDTNFQISQNSTEATLTAPTSTLPKSAATAAAFVTNTSKVKERVRPMRALSLLNYAAATSGNSTALPDPRFSTINFSLHAL
jgi:hypothetical protein